MPWEYQLCCLPSIQIQIQIQTQIQTVMITDIDVYTWKLPFWFHHEVTTDNENIKNKNTSDIITFSTE